MMTRAEFPRVLIVCPVPLNGQTGGGTAMSGFFREWPKDRLSQIYTYDSAKPDHSICSDYYQAPDTMRFSSKMLFPPIENLDSAYRAVRASRGAFQDGPNSDLDAVVEFAKGFEPDVIYCQPLHFPRYYWWLPRYLGAILDRPLVTHIMDDWPTMIANRDRHEGRELWVKKLNACLNDLFQNSTVTLGISDEMDRGFQERYGKSFEVLQNAIEIDEWKQIHKDYSSSSGIFKIMYIGKILPYMQHQSLQDIGEVASRLTTRGTPVDFIIHGPEHLNDKYGQELFSQPSVHYGGFLPRESFVQSLADADLLVVPVNFDEQSLSFVKYSMPAKVPEYMASGTPILVYSPAETPPAQYARKARWGAVVDERDLNVLEHQITTLINSPVLRQELGQRARAIALNDHSFDSVRARFRQVMIEAAASRSPTVLGTFTDWLAAAKMMMAPRRLVGRLPEPVKKTIRSTSRRGSRSNVK
jgi:glycosyltransferase involved in cell wall biosynthesis